jgi:histone chaperone ASF1
MAQVNVIQVTILDNPTAFTNPFQFEITFECLAELRDDLEWKVIYVGSAEDANADQVLEEVMVGPVPIGINKFVLQAMAPDHSQIPQEDLIGVTVVLVTCSFMDQEFIRIGYYVNNEYPEYDPENPPATIEVSKLFRSILADQPRVTRFNVDWTGKGAEEAQPLTEDIVDEQDENDVAMEEDEEEEDEEEDGDAEGSVDLEGEEEGEEEEDDEQASGEDEQGAEEMLTVDNEDSMDVLRMQQQAATGPNNAY